MPKRNLVPVNTLAVRRRCLKFIGLGTAAAFLETKLISNLQAEAASAKSIQLHIYIEAKPGKGRELEKIYHSAYVPAIKVQDGFLSSRLLRQYDSTSKYEIDISFKSEKQRATWAQSKEHQSAWPKVEALAAKITWQGFDQLA